MAKSGQFEYQVKGGGSYECSSTTATSGPITLLTAKLHVDVKGCKTLGFSIQTEGDSAETVLVLFALHLCYISKASKTVGASISVEAPPVILELPAIKKRSQLWGSAIGTVSPVNTKQATGAIAFSQTSGVQGVEKCEGEAARTLEISEDSGKTFIQTGLTWFVELSFSAATEVMA